MKVSTPPRRFEIFSGGQTGVDRGALDAALELGVDCGGWCPPGRLAEDGRIPDRYPLVAMKDAHCEGDGYTARTRRNVEMSDGVLILCVGPPSGGSRVAHKACGEFFTPVLIINAGRVSAMDAGAMAQEFVAKHKIDRLNVAGPRASEWPEGHAYAHETVRRLCWGVGGQDAVQARSEARIRKR